MTSTNTHESRTIATWTIAYRKPTANRFQRAANYAGTWDQAYELAGIFGTAHPELQVFYVPTAAAEALSPGHEDNGNVLTDSGKRVRMAETGHVADELLAMVTSPEEARVRGHAQAAVVVGAEKPEEGTCSYCHRPVFRMTPGGTWRLVYVEYERTWLCDARGMNGPHDTDQPLEVLPADDARELADTNALIDEISERHELHYHEELRHYSDGDSIAVIPCTERHEPAEERTSANAQPCPSMHPGMPGLTCSFTDGHSADHYALGYTWPNLRPVREDTAQPAKDDVSGAHNSKRCTTCGRNAHRPDSPWQGHPYTAPAELVSCENCSAPCDGTLTAYSELCGGDMPVCPQCYVSLTLVVIDGLVYTATLSLTAQADVLSALDRWEAGMKARHAGRQAPQDGRRDR